MTEGVFQAWTAAARRAQASTADMAYLTTFNVHITGSQHSDMFISGRIVGDVTLLAAFRERDFSNTQGRLYEVQEGDECAVVLCAEDQDPNNPDLSSAGRRFKHVVICIGIGATADDRISSCRGGVCILLGVFHGRRDMR